MTSLMLAEALETPAAVARQLAARAPLLAFAQTLRARPPRGVLTVARGSSDHAASYFAYLAMQRTGIPVTSLPMSLATLYDAPLQVDGALALAVSQSGQSPDLVETMRSLGRRGARTLALLNVADAPLAQACDVTLALHAGAEKSVAATKSCLAAMSLGAALVAAWQGDAALEGALAALPGQLSAATKATSPQMTAALAKAQRVLVVGRGPGLAAAQEAALKLKEACALQAEAFSGAELRHGPMALIGAGYPLVVFATRGPAHEGMLALAADMRGRGADVLLVAPQGTDGVALPYPPALDASLDPLCALLAFYVNVPGIASARGLDPDRPPHLSKVTLTR